MGSIIEFLKKNKEWIFSGIGVFILGGILSGYLFLTKDSTKKQSPDTTLTIITHENSKPLSNNVSKTDKFIDSLTPDGINEALKKAPIVQRNEIIKHYIGIPVKWEGELMDVHETNNNNFYILLCPIKSKTYIKFNININNYPGFALLKEGHLIKVEGKIENIENLWIELNDVRITYY
jgi:hypothetical protein